MYQQYNISALTPEEFETIRQMVYESIGVNLTEAKSALVVSRLSKRIRELKLKSFGEYICYLEENPSEIVRMFNYLTTNVTKFFREEHHFEYLRDYYLPEYEKQNIGHNLKKLRIWSAGCSTGEEPYTLAMVLTEYAKGKSEFDFEIAATDINTDVLDKAGKGIYTLKETEDVPYSYLKSYFKLGRGDNSGLFKVKENLQQKIEFRRANLAVLEDYPLKEPLDLLFCRNVFIYFDVVTREKVLANFFRCLKPGGLLFVGHSESVKPNGNNGSWRLLKHTIYEKTTLPEECK